MKTLLRLNWLRLSVFSLIALTVLNCHAVESEVESAFNLGKELYDSEQYHEALVEFNRAAFFSTSQKFISDCYYQMGLCYRKLDDYDKSKSAFRKAQTKCLDSGRSSEIQISLSATRIAFGDHDLAQIELLKLSHQSKDQKIHKQIQTLLFLSTALQHDWRRAEEFLYNLSQISDSKGIIDSLQIVLQIVKQQHDQHSYNPKILSAILPGLGQFYSKDYVNAANSFTINALNISVNTTQFLTGDYYSAIFYLLCVTERFYSGGIYQAGQSHQRYTDKINQHTDEWIVSLIKQLE